jgi:hypothetical protein
VKFANLFDVVQEWGTTYFTFEEDPEPFGRVRDLNIVAMCREMGITVTHEHSHTLYNLDRFAEDVTLIKMTCQTRQKSPDNFTIEQRLMMTIDVDFFFSHLNRPVVEL